MATKTRNGVRKNRRAKPRANERWLHAKVIGESDVFDPSLDLDSPSGQRALERIQQLKMTLRDFCRERRRRIARFQFIDNRFCAVFTARKPRSIRVRVYRQPGVLIEVSYVLRGNQK